jgi:hypothetical protein
MCRNNRCLQESALDLPKATTSANPISGGPRIRGIGSLRRRSISTELAISLVLLVAVVEGMLLILIYNRQADYLYRQLQLKADEYAVNLSETLAVPVWDYG